MSEQSMVEQPMADLRKDYRLAALDEANINTDPIAQFQAWFLEAQSAKLPEPNAMTIATVDADGRPSARIVLLKGLDSRGFVFYTNYDSRKGRELEAHPFAALVFHWNELERQVRIEGGVARISESESDAYFSSRPLGSRIGAWTSPQSEVVTSRDVLVEREKSMIDKYGDHPPRPAHWGGLRVVPTMIEFWQGRSSRLHDRLRYQQTGQGWAIDRLAP